MTSPAFAQARRLGGAGVFETTAVGVRVVAAAAGCAALAVVGLVDPSRHALGPPCPFKALTGYDCPLCGATRATHALLHGHLGRALDLNALYVAVLPVLAIVAASWLVRGRLPAWTARHSTALLWGAIGVGFAFLIVRNLGFAPFSFLAS